MSGVKPDAQSDVARARLAMQIALQLPDALTEAVQVLDLARTLTEKFVHQSSFRSDSAIRAGKSVSSPR